MNIAKEVQKLQDLADSLKDEAQVLKQHLQAHETARDRAEAEVQRLQEVLRITIENHRAETERLRKQSAQGLTVTALVAESYNRSRRKGWYDGGERNVPEMLALIHSEVSEALEDYRSGCMETLYTGQGPYAGVPSRVLPSEADGGAPGNWKPDGFPIELADVVIRVADLCGHLGIDLEAAIRTKSAFNETRPHRHGGKKC